MPKNTLFRAVNISRLFKCIFRIDFYRLTKPFGPCKVISGTPASCIVKAVPGRPPIFFQTGCVMKTCSNLVNFILCSCASL